jgi:hypothetical protein
MVRGERIDGRAINVVALVEREGFRRTSESRQLHFGPR